jgi:hypothetical protein
MPGGTRTRWKTVPLHGARERIVALSTNPQFASRFDPLHLARWKESDAFPNFVAAYGKSLPLRKASAFDNRDMVRLLLDRSDDRRLHREPNRAGARKARASRNNEVQTPAIRRSGR